MRRACAALESGSHPAHGARRELGEQLRGELSTSRFRSSKAVTAILFRFS